MRKRPHHKVGFVDVLQRSAAQTRGLGENDLGLNRINDPAGDVVLPVETIDEHAIVSVRPHMNAFGGVYQLCGDAHSAGRHAQAALQHVSHAQLARHRADVDRLPPECKTGIAGDNREPPLARQSRDDVFGETIGKAVLPGIATHVLKRQDGDRRPVRYNEGWRR